MSQPHTNRSAPLGTVNRETVVVWLAQKAAELGGQNKLAAKIGISKMFMSDVIRGHRKPTGKVLEFLGLEERTVYVFTYRRKA